MLGYVPEITASQLLGFAGAWFMARYAVAFGLIDIPNDRSSHCLPTPRGGGVGILVALTVSALVLKLPLLFWLPAALLSLVSFFDDKLDLSPRTRLVFQFTAALAVGASYMPSLESHLAGQSPLFPYLLLVPLCIFIVGTANFYNFMDGINGIAGITGAVGFGLIAAFARTHAGGHAYHVLAACMAAACLGFLPLNLPRARVFMGDVGSILLGFTFAILCVVLAGSVVDFLVLCGFLSTFYADALTTLYVRKRDGERLSQAHRRHLYQVLANRMLIPHWKISLGYGAVQAAIGAALLSLQSAGAMAIASLEMSLLCCWWLISRHLRRKSGDTLYAGSNTKVVTHLRRARDERAPTEAWRS